MPKYVALLSYELKVPIQTTESAFSALRVSHAHQYLAEVLVRPIVENGAIRKLEVEAVYEGAELDHLCLGGHGPEDGIQVGPLKKQGILFLPPWEVARAVLAPLLYQLSGFTLQSSIYWELEKDVQPFVTYFMWRTPDGTIFPPIPPQYPAYALIDLRDTGARPLVHADWATLQDTFERKNAGAPLWRLILAEAHRRRGMDARSVIVCCATALDVGLQPLMPPGEKVDMRLFRGEVPGTPDLRSIDAQLYETLAHLWFTRHGVVHRGEMNLYEQNPKSGAPSVRRLERGDLERFLVAVPRAIEFVSQNPPQ
ncbi:MAG: hypothetical protein JXB05_04865 [Myxococcaceae bacterium]|nr:hypothetical protein [Myxococcaceae bacterium]